MKRQCAIITAYKNPQMLELLLDAIHEKMDCFVYIDKRYSEDFQQVKGTFPDVTFQSPLVVKWGGVEHLKEILMGLKLCLRKDFSYVHIISGEDYPTVPVDELVNFFDGKEGIYSDCHLPDRKAWSKRYKCRWPYVKWSMDYKYNKAVKFFNAAVVTFQECFPFLQRKGIGEFEKVYMGLIWASYPKDAVEYIVDYIDHNQHFWKDLQTCKIPEEFCFPTILMNSPLKERMEYNNLRFGRFDSINGWGPVYATEEDLNSIDGKGCLFARKIDPNSHLYEILESRQKNSGRVNCDEVASMQFF